MEERQTIQNNYKKIAATGKKISKQENTEEVGEIAIQMNNITICEGVQHNNMDKPKIDVLAADEAILAEDIDG